MVVLLGATDEVPLAEREEFKIMPADPRNLNNSKDNKNTVLINTSKNRSKKNQKPLNMIA
jgi:hypothetical protein